MSEHIAGAEAAFAIWKASNADSIAKATRYPEQLLAPLLELAFIAGAIHGASASGELLRAPSSSR